MAGRPKEQKLLRTLRQRAQRELGPKASGLDYVVSWIESGKTIAELASSGAKEMGESCSRSWLSGVLNRRPEDKARIAAARAEAAHALIEDAMNIADEPAESTVDVQRNRLRAETRTKIASWWNREAYGDKAAVAVSLDLGQLHLDALRARAVAQRTEPMKAEVVRPQPAPYSLGPGSVTVSHRCELTDGNATPEAPDLSVIESK
jgi:hypothetical protein